MTWVRKPFALFPLVEVPPKVIDHILTESGRSSVTYPLSLAPEKYEDAPQKSEQRFMGDKPPIPPNCRSPFIGKSVNDVAEWMRAKPDSVELDAHHFALIDKQTEKDGSVIVCRVEGTLLSDMSDLDWMRKSAFEGGLMLMGMDAYKWEDREGERKPEIEY